MRGVLFGAALAAGVLAQGCDVSGRPEMRVCARVNDDGGCVDAREELVVGRTYTLVVRGRGVPEHGELELARYDGGRPVIVSTVSLARSTRGHATNPVTLPRVGTYRLVVREDGEAIARMIIRAPRPSVWGARRATPAETRTP